MRVTVVTAALNCREALMRTRRSVLSQREAEVQHVVIDGGSTDGTPEILARWAREEGLVYLSEPDSGVYQAFNKGLRLADGDCIGFLNAGDVYHDERVLFDVLAAFDDPGLGLLFGDIEITREASTENVIRRYSSEGFSSSHLLRGLMPPHPSIYARRAVYDQVGGFVDDFRIAGDFEWALRAFLIHELPARRLERNFVRMPAGGISNNGWESILRNTREMHRALTMHQLPASWLDLIARLPRKWLSR